MIYDQHNVNWALYNDRGSAYVTLNGNAEWASPKGYGGCAPVGHIVLENNYLADPIQIGGGCGPYPIDITQTNNTTISDNPTPGQVPNSLLSNAGIEASYASLVTQYGPSVETHYPNTGTANAATNVLITGSGFTSNDAVTFAGTRATGINVLSPNFLIATVASGTNLQNVSVVSGSTLATAFNNVGITDDTNPAPGNFDASGYSYSAQALAAAGATPGATIIHHGLSFTWPNVAAGSPDNVVAQGQSIALSGNGDTLGFLLTGVTYSPPATGSGTIVYSDGTQQAFTLAAPNWYFTDSGTGDQALILPYRNNANGSQDHHQVVVYDVGVSLQSNKTIAQVILPNLGSTLLPSLRIFAIALGYQSLATTFNNVGVSNDGTASQANFDASGYSYSAQALAAAGATPGATIIHHGLSFTWPNVAAGSLDNVVAQGQSIALSGNGDTLGFLLTGVTYSPPATGSGTIVYSDGTQQAFTLAAPNWGCSSGDQVLALPYRNTSNGTQDHYAVCVYYASISLQSGKTVVQAILPEMGTVLLPSLRIFAISIGNHT